jgi:pSer/pThr/pTyr-binding forkhead associated (FHA) protein
MYYRLVLVNTERGIDQNSWTLSLPTTVGRDPDLGVCINHDSISRTHCKIFLNAHDALTVRDLGSTNGTYVQDERVTQTTLMPGDILQLGSITLRVEYTSDTDHGRPKQKKAANLSATQPILTQRSGASRPLEKTVSKSEKKKWWQIWQ